MSVSTGSGRPRLEGGLSSPTAKSDSVEESVDDNDDASKDELNGARQTFGVKDRKQVVLDETGCVRCSSRLGAKPILEGRQGAHPADKFNGCSVKRTGEVKQRKATFPDDQQATENDEEDEQKVQQHNAFSQDQGKHLDFVFGLRFPHCVKWSSRASNEAGRPTRSSLRDAPVGTACRLSKRFPRLRSCLFLLSVALLVAVWVPASAGIGWPKVSIVVGDSSAALAARVLREEVALRSGCRWSVRRRWPRTAEAVVYVGVGDLPGTAPTFLRQALAALPKPGSEGFRLVVRRSPVQTVVVVGADARGALYGVGRLLRKLRLGQGRVDFPDSLAVSTTPEHRIRGVQVSYHPTTNTYDAWLPEQFERYVRDLLLFGANSVEILATGPDGRYAGPLMKLPPEQMMVEQARILARYDVDVWLFYPNRRKSFRDPKVAAEELRARAVVFGSLPRLNHVFVPGGDPGELPVEELFPWLERVAEVLHRFHPEADIWVSPQNPHATHAWLDCFVQNVNRNPEWLGGVVYGPWVAMSLPELRQRVRPDVPIRRYPDITHTISCQYPVPRWDLAWALTLGREPINPRPRAIKRIENLFHGDVVGAIAYSEGVNDDVNKFVWLDQAWDPHTPVVETLRDYARLFVDPDCDDALAQGLLALEENWQGPLLSNEHVAVTRCQWEDLARCASPAMRRNFRFQMGLLRALYDDLVRRRLLGDTEREARALEALRRAPELGSRVALEMAEEILLSGTRGDAFDELRQRCWALGDSLFHSVGLQLSVVRYGAAWRERGAFLDAMDEPLNNVRWLLAQFDRVRARKTEAERQQTIERILRWCDPGPGGFYDDLGSWESWRRVLVRPDWRDDPGTFFTPRVSFTTGLRRDEIPWVKRRGIDGPAVRLSWMRQVATLYHTPLRLCYEDLDSRGSYRLRVNVLGRFRSRMKLVADSTWVIHNFLGREGGFLREFDVPKEATADGKLVLEWTCPDGDRGAQVAEVWLIRE